MDALQRHAANVQPIAGMLELPAGAQGGLSKGVPDQSSGGWDIDSSQDE